MKYKKTLFFTILFFALITTFGLWSSNLGIFAMFSFLAMIIFFVVLFVMLICHLFKAVKEHFENKQRNILIAVIVVILTLTAYNPRGFIDDKAINGEPVLFASRRGAASCSSNLYLYENGKFKYVTICFGTESITGEYQIVGDSISFAKSSENFYKYAIYNREEKYLQFYKNESDTASVYAQFPVIKELIR